MMNPFLEGQVILIDKPLNWTSFQVVNKVRWLIKKKYNLKKIKVGHAGTLDPLATGLLILCTGKFTKDIANYQGEIKHYQGTFTLGATTPSYDLETEVDTCYPTNHIEEEQVYKTVEQFTGKIQQVPPIFSALKQEGKRLYELARAGQNVEVKPREVEIHSFEILSMEDNKISFHISCSKGTYIRSMAHDFGKALESGAYLSSLRRVQIGQFHVSNAKSIAQIEEELEK